MIGMLSPSNVLESSSRTSSSTSSKAPRRRPGRPCSCTRRARARRPGGRAGCARGLRHRASAAFTTRIAPHLSRAGDHVLHIVAWPGNRRSVVALAESYSTCAVEIVIPRSRSSAPCRVGEIDGRAAVGLRHDLGDRRSQRRLAWSRDDGASCSAACSAEFSLAIVFPMWARQVAAMAIVTNCALERGPSQSPAPTARAGRLRGRAIANGRTHVVLNAATRAGAEGSDKHLAMRNKGTTTPSTWDPGERDRRVPLHGRAAPSGGP